MLDNFSSRFRGVGFAKVHSQALLLASLLLSACTVSGERALQEAELRGFTPPEPFEKVDFTLTGTDGNEFSFRDETDGYLTLLFFGYTHCPDVCPLHLANIGAVLKQLSPELSGQVKVVFVTTDPERDTPERIEEWLLNFHNEFIGLTGTLDEVNDIQEALGLGRAYREEWPTGGYGMAHSARVLAFTADNLGRASYPFGTRQEDWAHDLPVLISAFEGSQ